MNTETIDLLRRQPRHVIVNRMREAKVTQVDVAKWAGVSPFYVNWTIARKYTTGAKVEKVWRELARLLTESGD